MASAELMAAYQTMANDLEREKLALEWIEGCLWEPVRTASGPLSPEPLYLPPI